MAIVGRISGKPPRWSDTFARWRPSELKSLPAAALANTTVAQQLSMGWLHMLGTGRRAPEMVDERAMKSAR